MTRLSKYNARLKEIAERRRQVFLKLRADGLSWVEIGTKYLISPQRARQIAEGKKKDL